jgi:hypothetical protein
MVAQAARTPAEILTRAPQAEPPRRSQHDRRLAFASPTPRAHAPADDARRKRRLEIQQALFDLHAAGIRDYTLPQGTLALDSALLIDHRLSGMAVHAHPLGTTVRNENAAGLPYPHNNAVAVLGTGVGYVDAVVVAADGGVRLRDAAAAVNYPAGAWCHAAAYDGYMRPGGMRAVRLKVVGAAGNALKFDKPCPAGCDFLKWYEPGTVPVEGAAEGRTKFAAPNSFSKGDVVYTTGGPCLGNNVEGEARVVVAADANSFEIDRPLRTGHPDAVAVPLRRAAAGVTLEGVTLEIPETLPWGYTNLFAQTCLNLKLVGVASRGRTSSIAGCGATRVLGCDIESLAFNACHDVLVRDGRVGAAWHEEAANDVDYAGVLFGTPAGDRAAVGADGYTGSRRIRLRDCVIEGTGATDWTGWPSSPLLFGGDECGVVRVRICGSRGGRCYVWGDRGVVDGLQSDIGVSVTQGADWQVSRSRAPDWDLRAGTGGHVSTAVQLAGTISAQHGWRVW